MAAPANPFMDWPTIKELLRHGAAAIDRKTVELLGPYIARLKEKLTPVPLPPDDPLRRPTSAMSKRPAKKKPATKPAPAAPPPVATPRATGKTVSPLKAFNIHSVPVTLAQWCMMVEAELDGMALVSSKAAVDDATALEKRGYGVLEIPATGTASFALTELGLAYMNTVPLARQVDTVPVAAPVSREVTEWESIDTAPTHTRVLLFGYDESGARQVAMCFRENTGNEDWVFAPQGTPIDFNPTKWKPVPAIPEE